MKRSLERSSRHLRNSNDSGFSRVPETQKVRIFFAVCFVNRPSLIDESTRYVTPSTPYEGFPIRSAKNIRQRKELAGCGAMRKKANMSYSCISEDDETRSNETFFEKSETGRLHDSGVGFLVVD